LQLSEGVTDGVFNEASLQTLQKSAVAFYIQEGKASAAMRNQARIISIR
jgi:hypothetical protein